MLFTLNQAAKATGRSKGTISKALASGQLSYISKDENGYQIEASELFRVFPKNTFTTSNEVQLETPEKPLGNSGLETEVRLVREQLATQKEERERERQTLNRMIDDLQKDRDHWRQQATHLLEDKRAKETTAEAHKKPAEAPQGFWARVLSKKS
jgi:hypothetical protein